MGNMTNMFKFKNGWSAELSGWYRTRGIEGQIYIQPMGQTSTAIAKQILKEKGTLETGIAGYFLHPAGKGNHRFSANRGHFS